MSVVGTRGIKTGKPPDPKSELWDYIRASNGEHCPIYTSCSRRDSNCFCPSGASQSLTEILDTNKVSMPSQQLCEGTINGRLVELIEMVSKELLRKAKVFLPPIPNHVITYIDEKNPIEVRLISLKNHHGALWRLPDGWVIHLNSKDEINTRRFTLFHEAFHIITHSKDENVSIGYRSKKGPFTEMLAELFSLCLLMPAVWIRQLYRQTDDLHKMVLIFQAPEPAVYMRLRYLHLI